MNFRRETFPVKIGNIVIGSNHPIAIQSMTNTNTADLESTCEQIISLHKAGSDIVRITVNNKESAANVYNIIERLDKLNCNVPIVGDFHFNGDKLLKEYPDCAKYLSKYRINPGNVATGIKGDEKFSFMIEQAILYDKPIRIGVNWGSLDQKVLTKIMDKYKNKKNSNEIMQEALIMSAIESANKALNIGIKKNKIILSCKVSNLQNLISIYKRLASSTKFPLHLGLTEAGIGSKAIVASSAALAILLQLGIGDTIRISITPEPDQSRTIEVKIAQELLQSMGFRFFTPIVTSCPGCGRTTSTFFQELAKKTQNFINFNMPNWKIKYPGVENLNIAVMGCVVNGPGESKMADIGISLPGYGETPVAPVYIDGEKIITLKGNNIADEFIQIIENYISKKFSIVNKINNNYDNKIIPIYKKNDFHYE